MLPIFCINKNNRKQSRTMETPKEYYYVYYSYEEWGRGYFGSRGCKCLPEDDVKYFGSSKDKTFKPTQKIILKSDYATRKEAYADEIVLQEHYKVVENPHFANRAYQTSTKFYVPTEQAIENGRKGGSKSGKKVVEEKKGIHGLTKEQKIEIGKKTGYIGGKITGKYHKENQTGIFAMSEEEKIKRNKKGGSVAGKLAKELSIGIFAISPEKKCEIGRSVSLQKWKCLETGFITNAGNLSKYQKARGIDTSKRVRIM